MAVANLFAHTGEAKGEVNLPEGTFGIEPNHHVMWEAVRNYLANQRQGTSAVRTRGEVRGGGKKPWRQKGTGRARVGTNRSVLWVGGARAFGPHPRDYSYRLPKRVRRLALKSALSTKAKEGEVLIVTDFKVDQPKTREIARVMKALQVSDQKCLLVVPDHDGDLARAARNIPNLETLEYRLLNTYQVLHADRVLIMESAVPRIEEAWNK